MFWPFETYTYLASGVIMISASSYLFYKIYRGSKSRFAYILISFTMVDGVVNFANFFIYAFLHPIYVAGQKLYGVNIYAFQTIQYLYYLGSLQTWIFAMKYWMSATNCSLTPSHISVQTIRVIQWSVIITYTSVMMAMYIWSMVTFPGFVYDDSLDQYNEWYDGSWNKITNAFWLAMIYGSTCFVIFALCKFFSASREIEKWYINVSLNKLSLVLHLLLLIFITVVTSIIPYVPYLWYRSSLFNTVITITDMIFQLTICYICLTMGSNAQLRKFRVTLDICEGVVRFKLTLKESIFESENFETLGNESRNASICSNQELDHLIRSQSLQNERGCDEIMQQFFNGIEDCVEPQRQSVAIQEVQEVKE